MERGIERSLASLISLINILKGTDIPTTFINGPYLAGQIFTAGLFSIIFQHIVLDFLHFARVLVDIVKVLV